MSSTTPASPTFRFLRVAGLAVLGMFCFWLLISSHRPHGGRSVGQTMPPISVQGWLNTNTLRAEDLKGKVIVLDAWASWCGPCRQQAPDLVLLYERYRDQGVEFIGLTAEPRENLDAMQDFLTDTGITWPNGYGAEQTLVELEAYYTPMVWVLNRDHKIVWNHESGGSLEEAIKKALAES